MELALRRTVVLVLAGALSGCRAEPDPPAEAPAVADAVPVHVAPVILATLADIVSGPGRTAAMAQEKVRAPFAGTLTDLLVTEGDRVARGALLATIVSRDSGAALSGAQEMVREAKTPAEKLDAERALVLAERAIVRSEIAAPSDGVVLSRTAARGDRVSEDQEILTITDASSIVFLADVAQSQLARVRPGQKAQVQLAGRADQVPGTVHGVLPGANSNDFTVPVRVDLRDLKGPPPLGLFGTARITVQERRNAVVAPDAALIRNDVTGVTRIALVRDGRAHWVDVQTGLRGPQGTEVTEPPLSAGQNVVVSGQVGLPEGALVAAHP